jgi:hypothetical protein
MNQEKLKKVEAEIAKTKAKVTELTARLRELERQKTEIENAGIIALVRDMDILPDELTAYIQAFKAQSSGAAVLPIAPAEVEITENDKEETNEEKD